MLSEGAYDKFRNGKLRQITAVEAERFFRVDDYVVGDARRGKIERAKNAFSDDKELSSAIQAIAGLVRER